jgi:hypothetical protein
MYDIVGENPYDKQSPMTTLTLQYATREVLLARGIIPKAHFGRGKCSVRVRSTISKRVDTHTNYDLIDFLSYRSN